MFKYPKIFVFLIFSFNCFGMKSEEPQEQEKDYRQDFWQEAMLTFGIVEDLMKRTPNIESGNPKEWHCGKPNPEKWYSIGVYNSCKRRIFTMFNSENAKDWNREKSISYYSGKRRYSVRCSYDNRHASGKNIEISAHFSESKEPGDLLIPERLAKTKKGNEWIVEGRMRCQCSGDCECKMLLSEQELDKVRDSFSPFFCREGKNIIIRCGGFLATTASFAVCRIEIPQLSRIEFETPNAFNNVKTKLAWHKVVEHLQLYDTDSTKSRFDLNDRTYCRKSNYSLQCLVSLPSPQHLNKVINKPWDSADQLEAANLILEVLEGKEQ